jgi:hypothetical protein
MDVKLLGKIDNHMQIMNFQQHLCDNITPPELYSSKEENITLQNEQIRIPILALL